jgi:hypothetical protein
MTVYFGNAGRIELLRTSHGQVIDAAVASSDLDVAKNSFGFKNVDDTDAVITGDLLEIKSTNGRKLEWLDASAWPGGNQHADIKAYVNINQAGQIRLYLEFEDAVNDEPSKRLPIVAFTGAEIPVEIRVAAVNFRCTGKITRFELNSEREAVDVSQIGEEFRNRLGTAISGNGSLEAFFDYAHDLCQDGTTIQSHDLAVYFHQLILRQQLGSAFKAKFYIITRGNGSDVNDEIWYDVDGVITNCGVAVTPTELIRSTVQFVTTGPIYLRSRFTSNYILQEDGVSRIAQERLQDGYLELEQQD